MHNGFINFFKRNQKNVVIVLLIGVFVGVALYVRGYLPHSLVSWLLPKKSGTQSKTTTAIN